MVAVGEEEVVMGLSTVIVPFVVITLLSSVTGSTGKSSINGEDNGGKRNNCKEESTVFDVSNVSLIVVDRIGVPVSNKFDIVR